MPEVLDGVVEQEVEAAPAEGETSSESASEEQQEPQDDPKPRGGFQKRIDKLTKRLSESERQAEHWRQQALTPKPSETASTPTDAKEPSENDFQTHAEYVKALTKYIATEAVKESTVAQRTAEIKAQQQKALQEFATKEAEFRAKTPDFDDVMADAEDVQASDGVIAEIIGSGPELKYYLAKNPDEVERLNKLAPLALAREVGRIESRFTTSEQKPAPKTTAAPPPPTPTGKSTATSTKDPGEMSPQEYKVWRAKQNAK